MGIVGNARYYVRGVGHIDLKASVDAKGALFFEGVRGKTYVRISSAGSVTLKHGDMLMKVDKDFNVGISGDKVTAKDFEAAIDKVGPSLSKNVVDIYEKLRKTFRTKLPKDELGYFR